MPTRPRPTWLPPPKARRVRDNLAAVSRAIKAGDKGAHWWVRSVSEISFQNTVLAAARLEQWRLLYHTHDSRESEMGWPDLVMGHPTRRRSVFAELKTETHDPTVEQMLWLDQLAVSGHEAYLLRPSWWDDVLAIVQSRQRPVALLAEWRGIYLGWPYYDPSARRVGVAVNARRARKGEGIELRLIDPVTGKAPWWALVERLRKEAA